MALDYSKLTDEELQAIANDDYTKLSDRTLRLLSRDKTAQKPAQPQETAAQSFGRGAASLADSALNALTGALDVAAYPFARAYYGMTGNRTPEQAAALAQQETTSPKDVVGRAFGVTGTAGYENAPLRSAGRFIGEQFGENVVQPVSQFTGAPEADVGNMLGTLSVPLAGPAGRAAAATGRAARTAAQVPVDVARGAVGRGLGYIAKPGEQPIGYQVPSSRIPLGETFIPASEMAQLRQGIPISEASIRPISELAPAPIMALSGGEIPVAGQAARAFGERLGETYRNPLTAAADIGSMFFTGGVPILTAGRGALGLAQAGADAYLARKGFTSLTPAETQALNQGINPFYTIPTGPVAPAAAAAPMVSTQPLLPYTPAGETPIAMPGPGRRVNIEGESFNLPYEINTSQVQTARPQQTVGAVVPTPEAQPAPIVTTQPVKALTVSETAGKTPEQLAADQKILDFINARRGIVANDPAANRQNFANKVSETRQQLEIAREQNKQMFGDRAKAMNERAGEGSMTPSQKDTITDATAVRYMINQTTQTAVKQQGKKVSYSEPQLNELATQAGITLDWKTAPDISNMGVGEARKAINKWMFDSIDAQSPELGLKTRRESLRAQERRAERESAGQPEATLSAEETEALRKRQEKLLGKQTQTQAEPQQQYANAAAMRKALYGTMPNDQLEALVNKTFPSVETLKQKMATPAAEDKAMNEALRQRLEALKQQGKYRGPKDVMEMMTGFDDMTPSQQAFKQQEMMDTMSGKPTYGEYFDAQGNRIVSQERYPHLPEFFRNKAADRDVPIVRKYDPEGNRIPMGEDWSASDPAPLKVVVKKRLSKEPYEIYWERDGEVILEKGNINKRFKIDPTVTVKRVEITQNPVGGDDALVRKYHGTSNKGEEVVINEYGDGAMSGTFIDAKGKERNKLY